jgi:hypothetical protein
MPPGGPSGALVNINSLPISIILSPAVKGLGDLLSASDPQPVAESNRFRRATRRGSEKDEGALTNWKVGGSPSGNFRAVGLL